MATHMAAAIRLAAATSALASLMGCAALRPLPTNVALTDDRDFYHDEDPPDDLGAAALAATGFGAPAALVYPAKKIASAALSVIQLVRDVREAKEEAAAQLESEVGDRPQEMRPLVCLPTTRSGSCR